MSDGEAVTGSPTGTTEGLARTRVSESSASFSFPAQCTSPEVKENVLNCFVPLLQRLAGRRTSGARSMQILGVV